MTRGRQPSSQLARLSIPINQAMIEFEMQYIDAEMSAYAREAVRVCAWPATA